MEHMETVKKIVNTAVTIAIVGCTILLLNKGISIFAARQKVSEKIRQAEICPALLSIGRSARDTLIVMKAESTCNSFVMDSLQ